MKHIVLVSPTLGGGGAERTVIMLANTLSNDGGCRVSLIVASTQGVSGQLKLEISPNVELVDFNCGRVVNLLRYLPGWFKYNQPDVVMSTQTHTNIICYFAAKWSGYKGKLIAREVSTPSVNLKHYRGVKRWFMQMLMRYVYRRVSHVVAVSQGASSDLESYLGQTFANLNVIYNPVINQDIFKKSKEYLDHPWFVENRDYPVVLAVGRLTDAKNYSLLLEAFALVIQTKPANLIILGEGENRQNLERMIIDLDLTDVVSLAGFDPNPFRYMARCDAYVMSSKWEGLPGSLIQALALGASVISTDCPSGPREILKDGKYGFLVKENPTELSNAIIDALQSSRSVNVDSVIMDFSVESAHEKYLDLICSQVH